MASQLILDRADPDIEALVAGWTKGETYRVSAEIVYSGDAPGKATCDVMEVVDETAAEPEDETPAEGEYAEKPKKPMGKPAFTIAFHK